MTVLGHQAFPAGVYEPGYLYNQQAGATFTLPSAGKITRLGCGINGYGYFRLCLWDADTDALLAQSAQIWTDGTTGNGLRYEADIPEFSGAAGRALRVGWAHAQVTGWAFPWQSGSSFVSDQSGSWPGSLTGKVSVSGTICAYAYFTAAAAPDAPTCSAPTGNTTDDTPAFAIHLHEPDAGVNIISYDIQLSTDATFASVSHWDKAGRTGFTPAQTVDVAFSYAPDGTKSSLGLALTRHATYYYRVRATNANGLTGAWSATGSFYLFALPSVDSLSPTADGFAVIDNLGELAIWADAGLHAKPRLTFRYLSTDALSAASYRIRVYDAASAGSTLWDSGTVAQVLAPNASLTVACDQGIVRTTSRWWDVVVVDAAGGTYQSARQRFRVQWGQAIYDAALGAGTAAWDFDPGLVAGGNAAFAFRTATASGGGGSTSAWASNIAALTPAAYLNVLVRMTPAAAGANVTLADMVARWIGAATQPNNWVVTPGAEWSLDAARRRFGTQALKCAVVAGTTGNRYTYPFRAVSGDDIPVAPLSTYTFSCYIHTDAPLTGGDLRLAVYPAGSLSDPRSSGAAITDTASGEGGWVRLTLTYTTRADETRVRPLVLYTRAAGVTETFWIDGIKWEPGSLATPWCPGAIGAVVLDSGTVAIDGWAGGALMLRAILGGIRDIIGLGQHGLLFGGDTEIYSPSTGIINVPGLQIGAATVTSAGKALIDDADAAAQRATLGLGTGYAEAALSSGLALVPASVAASGHLTGDNLAVGDTSWTAPTLVNSWVNYGGTFENAGYRKDQLGWVHLRGTIKSGSSATATMFTLPAGFRPSASKQFAIVSNAVFGNITVTTGGVVNMASGGSTASVSLDGVSFLAEA